MSKHILVIRHMYSADLCGIETILSEKNITITKVEGYATDISTINPLDYDAVIVLGGSMGVYQSDIFPYLHDEMALIRKCVASDHPMLGICLGAQLTAGAMGENVYKGKNGREIGFLPIDITPEGMNSPFRHFSKDKTSIFQWHGDTFDLPTNAVLLATSPLYRNQAFRIGQNVFASQFHPEVDHNGLYNTLVESCNDVDVPALRDQGKTNLPAMERQLRLFIDDLLHLWKL